MRSCVPYVERAELGWVRPGLRFADGGGGGGGADIHCCEGCRHRRRRQQQHGGWGGDGAVSTVPIVRRAYRPVQPPFLFPSDLIPPPMSEVPYWQVGSCSKAELERRTVLEPLCTTEKDE